MYSKSAILTAATDIVGYRESTDSNYATLPAYLKTSQSGFYINDLPIPLELIDDAKQEQTFNNYVINVHNSEILKIIQRFTDKQKKKLNTKELLTDVTMIQRFNDFSEVVSGKNSRFVGYAITPRESKSININLKSVGLQSSAAESFTLYLYDPTQEAAIQSKTVTCSGKSVTWTSLDWDIEFDKSDGGAGSSYLIGYFEDDLSGNLYQQTWSEGMAHQAMKVTRQYAGLVPVRFNNNLLSGVGLPDMEYLESSQCTQTSGFNLRLNAKCDITDVLVDNIQMFGEAVQYGIAIRYLKDAQGKIGLNPTVSSGQNRTSFQDMITDFEGTLYGGVIEGIGYQRGIMDNLTLDFSELDAICFKARNDRITNVLW
jgi:hypothetical protein